MKKIIVLAVCIVAIFTETFAAQFYDEGYGKSVLKMILVMQNLNG